jgi:hypothetical protein
VAARQPRHARISGGGHEAVLTEPLRARLRPACGPDNPGHAILAIAGPAGTPQAPAGTPQAPARNGTVSALIAADEIAVPGYDLIVADPGRVVAERYGLPQGGHVVIRPDGYVGAITGLDDDITRYFSLLSS